MNGKPSARTLTRVVVVLFALAALLVGLALPAIQAHWELGDPHKMHYPQLPDPNGWDVRLLESSAVADDWRCSETGPVEDIHFWISWLGDGDSVEDIVGITLHIFDDVPAGHPEPLWSHPGNLLWQRPFSPAEFTVSEPEYGAQGWYDPWTPEVIPNDHSMYFQINVENIPDPFVQQKDEIYWLEVMIWAPGTWPGWKTSLNHWNDDAVYWDLVNSGWAELRDPITDESLDMAFVITGEPTAIELASFTAEPGAEGVALAWETGTELDNAGFNLYRATAEDGPWTKINDALFAAQGDAVAGASYSFADTPGYGTFYYKLEDVDYYGVSTLHGPVKATVARPLRRPLRQPRLPEF
jgi:hypothetical protein